MDVFLTSIVCIVALLLYLLRKHQGPQNDNEPPMFRGAIPFIGHGLNLIGSPSALWEKVKINNKLSLKKGGVWSYYIFTHVGYMITDPDDALTVTNNCLDKSDYYQFPKAWIGDGLLTGKGTIWKVHRKVMNPAFNQHMLEGYLEIFNYQGRKIVDALKAVAGKPFDPWNLFRDQAFETVCLTLCGIDYSNQPEMITEMAQAAEDLLNHMCKRFMYLLHNDWLYSLTSLKKKEDALVKKLHDMTNGIIKERSEQLINNMKNPNEPQTNDEFHGKKYKTLLTLLLEAYIQDGTLSHEEIREELDTMIVAGHETAFTSTAYALVMIGSYPEVQERIYKEIMDVVGESEDIDKNNISKLVYLEAAIKESLRILPIVPIVARQLTQNIKLKNCTLSAGRTCMISLYGINRHGMWGPDASEYNPDRWFDLETLPTHPMAFASFAPGKRNCIGKTYAMMVMKTTIAHIIRNYEVVADRSKMKLKIGVTLKPKDPLSLIFNERQRQQ